MELSKSLMVLLFAAVLKLQGCDEKADFDLQDNMYNDDTATTDPTTYTVVGSSIGFSGIPLAAVEAAEPGIAAGIADVMGSRVSSSDVTISSSENVPYDRRLALLQRRLASAITVDFEIRIPEDMFVESVESVLAKAASDPSVLFAGIAFALSRNSTVLEAMATAGYSGGVLPKNITELMNSVSAPTVHELPVYDCKKCPDGFFDGCNYCHCSANTAACTEMGCTRYARPTCNDPAVTTAAPANETGLYDCEVCPYGFFDGCNSCSCGANTAAICTAMACNRYARPTCNDYHTRDIRTSTTTTTTTVANDPGQTPVPTPFKELTPVPTPFAGVYDCERDAYADCGYKVKPTPKPTPIVDPTPVPAPIP